MEKRPRVKPNRLGVESNNKDQYFEENHSVDGSDDLVALNLLQSGADNESESVKSIPFKDNELSKTDYYTANQQLSRIEAKLNQLNAVVFQIQRICISSRVDDDFEIHTPNSLGLPLETVASLNAFETKLSEPSFRKDVVSVLCYIFRYIII